MLENGNISSLDRLNTRRLHPSHLQAFHRESRLPVRPICRLDQLYEQETRGILQGFRAKGHPERVLVFFESSWMLPILVPGPFAGVGERQAHGELETLWNP